MAADHFHILARNGADLSGDARQLSARDVEAGLDGTPYGSAPAIRLVIDRGAGRGYSIVDDGWVAVARCKGTDQDECARVLAIVTMGGDVRAFHEHTMET